MSDAIALQVTQGQDTTRQNGPQFGLLEGPLLQFPLVGFIVQRAVVELEQRIQLEKGAAILILSPAHYPLQRGQKLTAGHHLSLLL